MPLEGAQTAPAVVATTDQCPGFFLTPPAYDWRAPAAAQSPRPVIRFAADCGGFALSATVHVTDTWFGGGRSKTPDDRPTTKHPDAGREP